jgi:tryptophan halogenase
MKNIVVVGGGTAGWLTALFAKKALPDNCKITLVESEEIGILGAGEGTTPAFISIMDWLGIPVSEFILKTGATFKNGSKFTNWRGDGSHYWHNFGSLVYELSGGSQDSFNFNFNHSNLYYHNMVKEKFNLSEIDLVALLCENNKVPHIQNIYKNDDLNPLFNYQQIANFAIHFDAIKVADFLKNIGIERGINWVEGKVIGIDDDINGNITKLITENNIEIDVDFIFDCSGFYKLIIGRHYKSKWKSIQDKLTIKCSQPFFLPLEKENKIPPYTEAIAMKYGWVWKIPLQHRFGCGYSFDTDYITKEEAKKEIIDYLGFEPEFGDSFSFRAGWLETPWVNNCIAMGVSSAFLEPLEASSIWTTAYFLEILFSDPAQIFIQDSRIKDFYNYRFNSWWTEVSDFIYLHYMGGRSDTKFWEKFQNIENSPIGIQKMLKKWEWALPRYTDFLSDTGDRAFQLQNWTEVCYGLSLLNSKRINLSMQINKWDGYTQIVKNKKIKQKEFLYQSLYHEDMLRELGGLNENK